MSGEEHSGRSNDLPRTTLTSLEATFEMRSEALQRALPVGAGRRAHADCHEAAVEGGGDRGLSEWQLNEVVRTKGFRDPAGSMSPTAALSLELVLPTRS